MRRKSAHAGCGVGLLLIAIAAGAGYLFYEVPGAIAFGAFALVPAAIIRVVRLMAR
jgi:hypothetical protein